MKSRIAQVEMNTKFLFDCSVCKNTVENGNGDNAGTRGRKFSAAVETGVSFMLESVRFKYQFGRFKSVFGRFKCGIGQFLQGNVEIRINRAILERFTSN